LSQKSAKDLLTDFGLTNKEAEVYLFLAKYEALTGGEITNQTKIARSLVYRILKSLQTKGLVEPTLESPTRFVAIPFEKAINLIIKTKQEEALQIERARNDLLDDWKNISKNKPKLNYEKFVIIEERKNIYSKILQMIKETKSHFLGILTLSSLARAEQFGVFETTNIYPLKSNSKFQFITSLTSPNLKAMQLLRSKLRDAIHLKIRNPDAYVTSFPRVLIRDDEEVLFFIRPETETSKTKQSEVCIYTNCESLVQTFKGIFQDLWQNSIDVDEAIVRINAGKWENIALIGTEKIPENSIGTLEKLNENISQEIDDWDKKLKAIYVHKISLLKEDEGEILECASVVGEKYSFNILEKVTGFNRLRLLKKLDKLERKHQLIHSTGEWYTFRHPRIREMLYNQITPKLRTEYHFLIAKHLENSKDLPEEAVYQLAYHYYHSGNSQNGVPFLLKAGKKAWKKFLVFDALRYYSQALEMMGNDSEWNEDRIMIFENLGDLYSILGRYDQANEFYTKGKAGAIKTEIKDRIQKKIRRKVTIEHEGVKLDYFVYGEGKPTIVFVGYSFHLMPQVHFFSQKYKVVLLDLSKNLEHKNPPTEYSLDYYIKYLKWVIDDLKTKNVYLVGFGLGGTLAIMYTTKHSGKITKLSVLATCTRPALGDSNYSKKQLNSFWAKAFLNPSLGVKKLSEHLTKIMDYAWSEYRVRDKQILDTFKAKDEQTLQLFKMVSIIPPEIQLIYSKILWETDIRPFLDKIKTPTLILHGEKDVIPLKAVENMSEKIPESKLYVFKGARFVSLFESQKCNKVLEEFFTSGTISNELDVPQ